MKFCGIDLHSNNSVVVVTDAEDRIVLQRRLPNELGAILAALAPHWRACKSWGGRFRQATLACGSVACSVRWSVPTWRCCPDVFAVTRGGYLERRDAAGREFPFKTATLTCTMQCAPSLVQRICRFLAMRWLTTWFTADSAMLLLIGRPLRCRAP